MFVENPLTEEEWGDEAEWLVERDRLTGRALRAWSHVEWRVLMLLENFTPHPRFDFAGQLWAGTPDFKAKLDMVVRAGHGHLPESQLEAFHALMASAQRHHAKVATITHHRACQAYFVEDPQDRSFVEEESLHLHGWIIELDQLAREIAAFTAQNRFHKGQLAYALRRDSEYKARYVATAEYAPELYRPRQTADKTQTEEEIDAEEYFTPPTLQGVLAAEAALSSSSLG